MQAARSIFGCDISELFSGMYSKMFQNIVIFIFQMIMNYALNPTLNVLMLTAHEEGEKEKMKICL